MKQTKEIYFDLNDLGKTFNITNFEFGGLNDLGITCNIYIKITDEKIRKNFNIPENNVSINFILKPLKNSDNIEFLFVCSDENAECNDEYERGGYLTKTILECFDENGDKSIPYVHLNPNLIRTLEAYATCQFFNSLKIPITRIIDKHHANRYGTYEDNLLFTRLYLLDNNAKLLSSKKLIKGEDIIYPKS